MTVTNSHFAIEVYASLIDQHADTIHPSGLWASNVHLQEAKSAASIGHHGEAMRRLKLIEERVERELLWCDESSASAASMAVEEYQARKRREAAQCP